MNEELINIVKVLGFRKYINSTPIETFYRIDDNYSILVENNFHVFLYNRLGSKYSEQYMNVKTIDELSELYLEHIGESLEPRLRYLKIKKILNRY